MERMAENEKVKEWWRMTDSFQESLVEGATSSEAGTPPWWKRLEEVFYVAWNWHWRSLQKTHRVGWEVRTLEWMRNVMKWYIKYDNERKHARKDCWVAQNYFVFPNIPPNNPPLLGHPSPEPPFPFRLASFLIHSIKNCLSTNCFPSVIFVRDWASDLSKDKRVGIFVIMYLNPRSPVIISWASYSTSAKDTPPSDSPTPEEMSSCIIGDTVRHVAHQEVVQSVIKGVREEAERRM